MTSADQDIQTERGRDEGGQSSPAPDWEAAAKIIRSSGAARLAETRGGRRRNRVGLIQMVMMAGVAVLLLSALAGAFSRILQPMMKNWKRDQEMAVAAKEKGLAESGQDVGMPGGPAPGAAALPRMNVDTALDPLMAQPGETEQTPADHAPAPTDTPARLVPDQQSQTTLAPDQLAALQAVAPAGAPPRPWAAIVVTEVGGNAALGKAILAAVPMSVAIGIAPGGSGSRDLATAAVRKGHEVWAGIPMQPLSYPRNDPGPHTIRLQVSPDENAENLSWALAQAPGAVGAYNIMGSAVTRDTVVMTQVLRHLKGSSLMFLDARAAADTVSKDLGERLDVPVASNDRYIEATPSVADISILATQARQRGYTIAFVEASPRAVKTVQTLVAGLEAEGVNLVSPSMIARYTHPRAVAAR